jgi:hypothetical protein
MYSFILYSISTVIGKNTLIAQIPIFGYHKRYYIFIAASLMVLAFAVLAAAPLGSDAADFAAILFFSANFGIMVVDLLCEVSEA